MPELTMTELAMTELAMNHEGRGPLTQPDDESERSRPTGAVGRSNWRAIEAFATKVAERPELPQVDPDDFIYEARTRRTGLTDLHSYRHVATRRYLHVDMLGVPYRFAGAKAGPGGYAVYEDVADALAAVELALGNRAALRLRKHAVPDAAPRPWHPEDTFGPLPYAGDALLDHAGADHGTTVDAEHDGDAQPVGDAEPDDTADADDGDGGGTDDSDEGGDGEEALGA